MVDNTSGLTFLDQCLLAPPLNEQEKALRDLFVEEYVKDFDAFQACIRVGFQATFAVEYAKRFYAEPYVQRRIAEKQREPVQNTDVQQQEDKALILSVLRQAAQNGPYASRVAAAKQLATIHGFDRQPADQSAEQQMIELFRNFAQRAPV